MKEKKIKSLIWNAMFEVVFDNQVEVVIAVINDCCGTNYQVGMDEIKIKKRQIPRIIIKEVGLTREFIVEINRYNIYNIELKKSKCEGLEGWSWNYLLKIRSSRMDDGCKYRDLEQYHVKQINLNQVKKDENIAVDNESRVSYTARKAKYKDIMVFRFDIEYCYNLVYNTVCESVERIPKLYRWGAIFYANSIEEIDYILGSDMLNMETKKELLKMISDASANEIVLSKISLEEDFEEMLQEEMEFAKAEARKIGRNEGYEIGLKEGLMQGRQEKEETIIDTIKSMLDSQLEIELISKIINKSEEEILKIQESI